MQQQQQQTFFDEKTLNEKLKGICDRSHLERDICDQDSTQL